MPKRRNATESSAALKRAKVSGPQAEMRGVIEWLLALPEAERLSLQEAELATFGSFHPESSWVMTAGPVPKQLGHDEPPLELVFAPRYSAPAPGGPTLAATLDCGVVECAELLCERGYRPAVLNFAHGYNAGGGFEHAKGSQEEALMRRTSLFLSLWPHRRHDDGAGVLKRGNWIGDFDSTLPRRQPYYPHSSAGGIYSPNVRILPRDIATHSGGEVKAYPKVGVLSVAAQDVRREPPFQIKLLREKIRTVLHLAASHGHDALVLGAFGCGYFANPRADVVATFKELLEGEFSRAFRFVGFAVPRNFKTQVGGKNFKSFADAFPVLDLGAVPSVAGVTTCAVVSDVHTKRGAAPAAAAPSDGEYIGFYKSAVPNADKAYKRFNNLDRAPFTIPAGGVAARLNPAVVGVQFEGVENAFQLLKFLPQSLAPGDVSLFAKSSGAVAFYLGSSNASNMTLNMQRNPALKLQMHDFKARRLNVRPGWDKDSPRLMKELLELKFSQNSRLKALLLSTGSLPIVERSPTDGVPRPLALLVALGNADSA